MNAVEIEEAISALAERPFDPAEFPFAFLEAFGNKETTLKRLRKGESNKSDLGGVLQTNNIHIAVAAPGEVTKTLAALKASPATARAKAKFVLATDGDWFEAEDLVSHAAPIACAYADFPDHFGFFLPLAGISTVRQISENAFDIRATGRLNRLYVELLKGNPEWDMAKRRHDMNHFMARLIFCFFAEKTDIFFGGSLFTDTVAQMSTRDGSDVHFVISEIFRVVNTRNADRAAAKLRGWVDAFPYINGGLFSGSLDVPRFSRTARSYLLNIGGLDWTKINPDIFGSMIQAVAEDEERGVVGVRKKSKREKHLYLEDKRKTVNYINAYLVDGPNVIIEKHPKPISDLPEMFAGNISRDKGNFTLTGEERDTLLDSNPEARALVRKIVGSMEVINGIERSCLWISDETAVLANGIPLIYERLQKIRGYRERGSERGKLGIETPHRFERTITGKNIKIIVPRVSSERREYIPIGFLRSNIIISDAAQTIYDPPLFVFSIISSRIHVAWVGLTAGRMKSDYRYSAGVCYNSFPLPRLTDKNVADLTRCAEGILLAREAHFPATIADLYDPETMPADLREAHDCNDEMLERIYIGRRFKNDTERLEKLFELYTKMTAAKDREGKRPAKRVNAQSAEA